MPDNDPTQPQEQVPDTARVYERAKPEKEAGMGRLDNNKATPANRADPMEDAVANKQVPRQVNAQDLDPIVGKRPPPTPGTGPDANQHSRSSAD